MWVWYCLPNSTNNTQNLDPFHTQRILNTLPIVNSTHSTESSLVIPGSNDEVKIPQFEFTPKDSLLTSANHIEAPKTSSALDFNKKQKKVSRKEIIVNLMGKKTQKVHYMKKETNCSDSKIESWNNPGRNSTSNIFRVFIKLCSKSKHQHLIKTQFEIISRLNSFFITFNYFKIRLAEVAPSTSNYINLKEFRKTCEGEGEFCKAFRCLFHWFVKDFATTHILTLKSKSRMAKESIACFISNLHEIENEIWGKDEPQDESENKNSTEEVSED